MDIGAADDSDYEYSGEEHSEDADLSDVDIPKNVEVQTVQTPRSSPSKESQTAKWLRLRKHHNPKYLNLFRDSWEITGDASLSNEFESSQIGVVSWLPDEKCRLFAALEKVGRRGLKLLAEAVETKSELEIYAYLLVLRQSELERQQFSRHSQNITQAEIPAAVEISPDVETALERAADALSAYQEQFDYTVASRATNSEYVVNSDVATQLDAEIDTEEQAAEEGPERHDLLEPLGFPEMHKLFRIKSFCELSEKVFMKGTRENPTDNWMSFAEAGESPSLTRDALSDFGDLVVSFLRRLVQTTVFVTQSRLRATTTRQWKPLASIRLDDVESALDILNVKQSLSDYWLKFPRRCGLAVISGSHGKGARKNQSLTLEEVEQKLSMPGYRGRHSRSVSRATESEISASTETRSRISTSDDASVEAEEPEDSADESNESHIEPGSELANSTSDEVETSGDEESTPAPVSQSKRRRLLEEEQDKYMEELDQRSRRAEERYLVRELGLRGLEKGKEEEKPPSKRPKVLRKTVDEVNGWQVPYVAFWEAYDLHPPTANDAPSVEAATTDYIQMLLDQPAMAPAPADSDHDNAGEGYSLVDT